MTAFLIILMCILLAASAFFSSSETALFSINTTTLKTWADNGNAAQKLAAQLMDDHHRTITTILLGNCFVNIMTAVALNTLLVQLAMPTRQRLLAATVLNTGLLLAVGEVTPKAIAYTSATTWAPTVARPIYLLSRVLQPLVTLLKRISGLVLHILGSSRKSNAISIEEYRTFTRLAHSMGVFNAAEVEMFDRVFALRETHVCQFMIPRPDVKYVDQSASRAAVEAAAQQHCHRFLPVVDGDLDHLVGVLDVVALAFHIEPEEAANWLATCVSKPMYVPENGHTHVVLAHMRKAQQGLAFVVNEFGGIEGMITAEDIYEQMVGELTDEFDPPEWKTTKLRADLWRVNGLMPLVQLEAELNILLPEHNAETLGGILAEVLDHLPRTGESWEHDDIRFTVQRVHRKRVTEVEVALPPGKAAEVG